MKGNGTHPSGSRTRRIEGILWGLVLFSLPVTSFRLYPNLFGAVQVKPLAFIPLVPFLALAGWRVLRGRQWGWLRALVPLGVFALFALLSTAYGWVQNPPPLFGITYTHRVIRAWLSFAIGLVFLLGALWAYQDAEDLFRALPWLYAGFVLDALWGTLQIAGLTLHIPPYKTLSHLQTTFSLAKLHPKRISGMANEPSWLAEQLVTLYFPWLVAALLSGVRILRRWWVEAGLLVWGGLLLVFTVSRSGVLVAVVTAGGVGTLWLLAWGRRFLTPERLRRLWPRLLAGAGVAVALLAAGIAILMRSNYFAVLFHFAPGQSLVTYFVNIRGGPRLAYNWAAVTLFGEHPWLGVGLGASGFSLYDLLPDWSRTMLPEIARLTSPLHRIFLNPKNMYARLLAETGLLGFLAFLSFLFAIVGHSLAWWAQAGPRARFLAVASLWMVIAIAIYWLTQDSLTFPHVWLGLGTILALAGHPAPHKGAQGSKESPVSSSSGER